MSITLVEQHVTGSNGVVKVRDESGFVKITWMCGDVRTFTKDQMKDAIQYVEEVSPVGIWVQAKDNHGYEWAGKIVDGEFYADNSSRQDEEGSYHVPWADLKKAIKKAL